VSYKKIENIILIYAIMLYLIVYKMSSIKGHKTNDSKSTEIISWCRFIKATELGRPIGHIGPAGIIGQGIKIVGTKMCQYGKQKCRAAHEHTQLSIPSYITTWNEMDKKDINLLSIQNNIIESITQGKDNIKNPKYISAAQTINKMNLDELIQFWYDITCFHRKLAKELPYKRGFKGSVQPEIVHGYRYREDVPTFNLNDEDNIWALKRTLCECEANKNMMTNRHQVHTFFSICCGDDNACKLGEHDSSKIACIPSLLTGVCSCLSLEQITAETLRINTIISSYDKQLEDSVDMDGFQVKLSKKVRDNIIAEKHELQYELSKLFRKRHYCDEGMVSLAQRIIESEESNRVAKVVDVSKIEIKATGTRIVKKKY